MLDIKFNLDPIGARDIFNIVDTISINDRRCAHHFANKWAQIEPLAGKKILLNCHLTKATLLLVELFISAGAKFHITCSDDLVCHDTIKQLLIQIGLYRSIDTIISGTAPDYYDVVVDCGAFFAYALNPKIGFVELTYVSDNFYENITKPVLSIDKSFVKKIETFFGTGDGFVRAYKEILNNNQENLLNNTFMIFGYGKVGSGIATCLLESGIKKEQIYIIEKCRENCDKAEKNGLTSLMIDRDYALIKNLLNHTISCAITATGVTGCISEFFSLTDFKQVNYLVNMGTYDEWGSSFPDTRILNHKKPLNFILECPTKIELLDPIFTLLVYATINLVDKVFLQEKLVEAPSIRMQEEILDIWLINNTFKAYVDILWKEEKRDYHMEE